MKNKKNEETVSYDGIADRHACRQCPPLIVYYS